MNPKTKLLENGLITSAKEDGTVGRGASVIVPCPTGDYENVALLPIQRHGASSRAAFASDDMEDAISGLAHSIRVATRL